MWSPFSISKIYSTILFIKKQKYFIGIDEAGRGPLAGPVSVGVACVPDGFDWNQIPGVNDSKKLTENKRDEIFEITKKLKKEGKLQVEVTMVGARVIDSIGIVPSIQRAMNRALNRLEKKQNGTVKSTILSFQKMAIVKLDGGLKAPDEYLNQETIVKGDSKEKVIGLASIMAKVTRDRYMIKKTLKPDFQAYAFEAHKGYGTKKHREAIAECGLSSEHRQSFCRNIVFNNPSD